MVQIEAAGGFAWSYWQPQDGNKQIERQKQKFVAKNIYIYFSILLFDY